MNRFQNCILANDTKVTHTVLNICNYICGFRKHNFKIIIADRENKPSSLVFTSSQLYPIFSRSSIVVFSSLPFVRAILNGFIFNPFRQLDYILSTFAIPLDFANCSVSSRVSSTLNCAFIPFSLSSSTYLRAFISCPFSAKTRTSGLSE